MTGAEPGRRADPRKWGPVAVVVAVVVANLAYLTGLRDPNPVLQLSGLGSVSRGPILAGRNFIDPNVGFTAQALGHLAALDWLHGHVPWWNPFEGIGAPLAGEMQSAALFPLVLLDALPDGQVWFRLVLELVAGLSAYFLACRLVRSRWAATAVGVAFGLNGTFSWLFHAAANPVAFLPLLLLGVEQALDRRTRGLAGWPLIGLAVALSLYAGFPEVAYIDGLLAVVWFAVRASELVVADLVVFLRRGIAGLLLGGALAAPVLVAFLTYLPYADTGNHGAGYAGQSLKAGLALPTMVMPYVFGPIFGWGAYDRTGAVNHFWGYVGGYAGVALLLLAVVGILGKRDRRLRVALGAWVALGVARSVGVPVVASVVNAVPGVSHTIFFRYAAPTWSLGLAVLAGFGIDDLARARRPAAATAGGLVTLGYLGAAAALAVPVLRSVRAAPDQALWTGLSAGWAVLVAAGCVVGALLPGRRWRAGFLAGLVALEALAYFVVPQLAAPGAGRIDTGPVRFLQAHLGTSRFFTIDPIQPNYGSYWGLGSVAVNDNPVPASYAAYITASLDPNVDPLLFSGGARADPAGPTAAQEFVDHMAGYEAVGVKYLLGFSFERLPAGVSLPVVYRDPQVTIWQVPHSAPLMSVSGACRLVAAGSGGVTATAVCSGPGMLVRRELYLPGWSATDNGRAVAVSRSGPIFQAAVLSAGVNHVRLGFSPPYSGWSELSLFVGLAVTAGAPLRRRWPGRGRAAPRRC